MSENPVNPDRSQHIDTRLYFLRDMVCNKVLRLRKVPGVNNVADALTKSLPAPALHKHRVYLWGSRIPFQAFFSTLNYSLWRDTAKITQVHACFLADTATSACA